MEFVSFKENCKRIFALNGLLEPNDVQIEMLFALTERMLEVNKHMNLTAITEENAVILRHYADSLTVSQYIPQGSKIIDIGCGAGFPSLPLAIFRSDLNIMSLDSTAKRIEYVRATAEMLGLDNVIAISGRAEEYANKLEYREHFDVATARAVASLPILSELCLPFVKEGGLFVAMKGAQGERELNEAKNAITLCGGLLNAAERIELTANSADVEPRFIVTVKKITPTPQKYPRHYSQISKKPL